MRLVAIFMILLLSISPALATTYTYCIDNSTLRQVTNQYMTTGNITTWKTQDFTCISSCTNSTSPPSCNPSSSINIWMFGIVTVLGLFLMFLVYSPIVNIVGAFLVIIEGAYILIAGIDFTPIMGLAGTASSLTISNTVTYGIGFVLIGLALFRIAIAFNKM